MKKRKPNNKENWSHKNDFPIEEVWNTDNTLSQLIVPRLLAFKALDKQGTGSSRARVFHPHPLTEPCVKVSPHTALHTLCFVHMLLSSYLLFV